NHCWFPEMSRGLSLPGFEGLGVGAAEGWNVNAGAGLGRGTAGDVSSWDPDQLVSSKNPRDAVVTAPPATVASMRDRPFAADAGPNPVQAPSPRLDPSNRDA